MTTAIPPTPPPTGDPTGALHDDLDALIDIAIEDERWPESLNLHALVKDCAQAVLGQQTHSDQAGVAGTLSILFCDDPAIKTLNNDYRGQNKPTNVLAFPGNIHDARTPGPPHDAHFAAHWGDIAIAYDTCHREALDSGVAFDHHIRHLVIHGLLHLNGYDHIEEEDAALMEALEIQILATMGVDNPYRESDLSGER